MLDLLIILVAMVAVSLVIAGVSSQLGKQNTRLTALARTLELTVPAPGGMTSHSFGGSIEGFSVRGEQYPGTDSNLFLVTVGDARALPREFSVARRTPLSLASPEHTGDPEFDRAFVSSGDPTYLSSSLTTPIREALFAFPEEANISLNYGQLTARVSLSDDPAAAAALVRAMIALAHRFGAADSPAEQLSREFRAAKVSSLATTTFRRLMLSRPAEAIAREAVDHAIASEDPPLLALAVEYARPPHAERLREIFHRYGADDYLRAETLHALRRIYEPPPMDLPVLSAKAGPRTREAVAVFLGTDDRTTNEPLLISLLSDTDAGVQFAAARSLLRTGTVLAVAPLRAWAQGLFRSVEIKELAEEAVRAIQSRAANRGAGQLSLAGGDGSGTGSGEARGAVSLAENKQGALSDTEE